MKNKKMIIMIVILISLAIIATMLLLNKNTKEDDGYKFSQEYTEVSEDNVFVYRNSDEIINILEKGTGVVFLGFPECKWCQRYAKYLNEVAEDVGIEKIYYYNIKEDRANNSEFYQKVVNILTDNLDNDEEGNPRIFVPDVTFVNKGEIVGHDNETSMESGDVDEYWTEDKIEAVKERLSNYMMEANPNTCNEGCDE